MKNFKFTLIVAGAALCLGCLTAPAQTIMPLGDSVTARGADPESSYRYWLWTSLQNAGFTGVSFIGSQFGVSDGAPANTGFDQHYEGGDGWSTQDALDNISGITAENPDIVLLDLGANDIEGGAHTMDVIANLSTIIDDFRAVNPNVTILLAEPTSYIGSHSQKMGRLASAIGQLARKKNHSGSKVIAVNLYGGFNPRKETVDGTHPNIKGEQFIAKQFFKVLSRQVL